MGAHGEPGVERRKLMPADALAEEMMRRSLVDDLPFRRGDRVALLLNDLGATTHDGADDRQPEGPRAARREPASRCVAPTSGPS